MRAPNRHRRSQHPAPPSPPLYVIVREYEAWRQSQGDKPARDALRAYWKPRDQQMGARAEYQLWRQTVASECPLERRQDVVDLALRALRSPDPQVHWAALALVPAVLGGKVELPEARRQELTKAVLARLSGQAGPLVPLSGAENSCAAVKCIVRAAADHPSERNAIEELQEMRALLTRVRPDWKPGKEVDLSAILKEGWLPLPALLFTRWFVAALRDVIDQVLLAGQTHEPHSRPEVLHELAPWLLSVFALLRDSRPPRTPPRLAELEVLLDAAGAARMVGDLHEAARLTVLASHLLPAQSPEALAQRFRVAAWTLAEAGLAPSDPLRVSMDRMLFPGDPPGSDKGLEAARLYLDPDDAYQQVLVREVAEDVDWQQLRSGGVALHHPLPALAWVARKAQAYALKKQHDLLRAAARLAARHHRLTTLGHILAQSPDTPEAVVGYAESLRESLRRMPLLRDLDVWREWTSDLRTAWGKLEADAIEDPETVFMLHETLLDRDVTTLRSLPIDLRLSALKHLHSRRHPSPLVQALEAEPRLMRQMEHQRAIELWSVAAELRERQGSSVAVWMSLVLKGEASAGRYSLLVQGPTARVQFQGRVRTAAGVAAKGEPMDWQPVIEEMVRAASQVADSPEWVLLAVDHGLENIPWAAKLTAAGLAAAVSHIPGWSWAFRVLREPVPSAEAAPEVLEPEQAESTAKPALLPSASIRAELPACLLLPGHEAAHAGTRWRAADSPDDPAEGADLPAMRRSLHVGKFPLVVSLGPLLEGELKTDLVRLSLAQGARCVVWPNRQLTAEERGAFVHAILQSEERTSLAQRLRAVAMEQPGLWSVAGIPWK